MNCCRPSWISSIVIDAATVDIASISFPWMTSFKAVGSWVRAPRVRAAVRTPSLDSITRTENSVTRSILILFFVMRDCSPCRRISIGTAFMFTTVMSWMIGMTNAPPPITTRSPPDPVLTKL